MRHPTDGTLRRLVDEPVGVSDADRAHVANCPECLAGVAAAQEDATFAGAALEVHHDADVDLAWQRLSLKASTSVGDAKNPVGPARSWRARLRSPVAAGVGVLALLAGASAAAAGDWFQIFSTEQVAPVTITQESLVELPDLSAYGQLVVVDEVDLSEVPTAAAAEEATGLEVPQVEVLPQGVRGEPVFEVVDQVSGIFTFSVDEAQQSAEAEGETLQPPPAGLDGSQFRLEAGPGLAAIWTEQRGLPALVVARAVAPTVYSSGVPFETARDYLLSLPGLPEDIESQLRSFAADGATLPVPVPEELMTSSTTEINGADATLVEARDGTMAAVIWVEDGVVTAVAGSVSDDEVLTVARGLG